MFDALGIHLCRLLRDADRHQQIDHEPMPRPRPPRQHFAGRRQKHAAIELRCRQPLALQARDALDGGRMRDAEPPGNVGASPSVPIRSEMSSA